MKSWNFAGPWRGVSKEHYEFQQIQQSCAITPSMSLYIRNIIRTGTKNDINEKNKCRIQWWTCNLSIQSRPLYHLSHGFACVRSRPTWIILGVIDASTRHPNLRYSENHVTQRARFFFSDHVYSQKYVDSPQLLTLMFPILIQYNHTLMTKNHIISGSHFNTRTMSENDSCAPQNIRKTQLAEFKVAQNTRTVEALAVLTLSRITKINFLP